ncbi:hypothetical protein [Paraburkholderia oxyphila]|uniref:hypothetical protein n=1 Tax=Paraburkholderia oxyphila TaxID=614212 RepID=UPI000485F24E|nr:hypothetical protein [Paraburkholderia oxyphila]
MKLNQYRYLLLLLALITFVGMARYVMPFPADFEDSYIMDRYAQNGVDGFLYEWNQHSAPVQGTTGLAWVTLITAVARLTKGNVVSVNSYSGLIFAILTLVTVYAAAVRSLKPGNRWVAVCALIPIISCPFFLRASGNGLETSITVFFVALSVYFLHYCRGSLKESLLLGLFSGFTFLVRPDLPLFPVSLYLSQLVLLDANRTERAKSGLALLGGVLAASLISLLLAKVSTGTALPLSASLKLALSDLLLGRLPAQAYIHLFGDQLKFFGDLLPLVFLAIFSITLTGLRSSRKYLPIYVACAVYFAYLFTVLPIMDIGFRFKLPLQIGMAFAVIHFFDATEQSGLLEGRRHLLIIMVTILVALGNSANLFSEKKDVVFLRADHTDFQQMGEALGKIDGIIIASPEAGKLAAASGKKFLDTVGLNDVFIAQHKKSPDYPALLLNYLKTDFGMPDVYIRKTQTPDPRYTFLEILPDFNKLYACNNADNAERTGKVVCLYRFGSHLKEIASSLAPFDVQIELP